MEQPFNQLFKHFVMNTENNNQNSEQEEKHRGGWHIFLFMGIALVALILLKLLVDNLMN